MKMRSNILLAQLPIAGIIILITIFFASILASIQKQTDQILVDNFKSIRAMHAFEKSLEKLNEFAKDKKSYNEEDIKEIKVLENTIEKQIIVQIKNTKTEGEKYLTEELHKKWGFYRSKIDGRYQNLSYLSSVSLEPFYQEVRQLSSEIAGLNQDEILRNKNKLNEFIFNNIYLIIFMSIGALSMGLFLSWSYVGFALSPLAILTESMSQVGKEERTTLLHIKGPEEIEKLCQEFNSMITRLTEDHQGSIGQLMTDYQTLKSALDALSDPIFLLDRQTNIIFINRAAQEFLGGSPDLKLSSSFFQRGDDLRESLITIANRVLQTKMLSIPEQAEEAIILEKEDRKTHFLPFAYPILKRIENGYQEIAGVIIILRDLMRQPLAEMSKRDVYESLVHEFQAPLIDVHMAIHLCIQKLAGPLTEKQEDILYEAQGKCEDLEKLCQDLLNLSQINQKKPSPKEEEIDVADIVSLLVDSLQLGAHEKGILIHFESPPYLSKVKANKNKIQTVIRNLLRNAIYYADRESMIRVRLKEKKGFIYFSVNNKGPLISPEYRKKIFEKYYKIPGQPQERAGLGLYITKQIIHALGGKIGFRSTEKQGTTFWVSFPVVQENLT